MPINLPLVVRKWGQEDDEWPDRRISLGSGPYAIMISPRMASLEVAEKEASFIAESVNEYADALSLIHDLKEKLGDFSEKGGESVAELISRAEKALEVTSFDRLG
jgi:hypothetical protein